MKINQLPKLQRREFLRRSAQLGLAGVAAPWALNLAALGEAAAANLTSSDDYKALVCVFLYGGNDNGRTLIPVNDKGINNYDRYAALRGRTNDSPGLTPALDSLEATTLKPKARAWVRDGGDRGWWNDDTQLAMAPELYPLKTFFDKGQLGWLLNVGTLEQETTKSQPPAGTVLPTDLKSQFPAGTVLPPNLFSHNDQQSFWQCGAAEGATLGYAGRMGDLFLESKINSESNSSFTCINTSGNAVFMTGNNAFDYRVSTSGAVAINALKPHSFFGRTMSRALLTNTSDVHWIEQELINVRNRSINCEAQIKEALNGTAGLNFPNTNLGDQLKMVARLIRGRSTLGAKRQVFFVSLGGFDHHDFLLTKHPALMAELGGALAAFQNDMDTAGVANNVTTFTASDFGRTLTSNGDGSDHGWGSYHLVMGGAVKGGKFWGHMPVLGDNNYNTVGQGRLLPTTSVAQMTATLAKWLGVSDSNMPSVVPNICNFNSPYLGFFDDKPRFEPGICPARPVAAG